ncbi:hypothetical protein ASE08_12595 [Rhizobacter sp. Root16D2]|nr:hypothetical protein ASC98_06055 [Rhizobacter sp. Root1238]KRB06477.1 hypothetical protein ASE08_12595 [Rhizobacter sp. Root16D2]
MPCAISVLFSLGKAMTSSTLDYEQMILLDAENLAEAGIGQAYETILPGLARLVSNPAQLEEHADGDTGRYAIKALGTEYLIYAPELDDSEGRSWGRATWALFSIVNSQLENSSVRLYAINGGNDLGGMFLTASQVEQAKASLKNKTDWPYLPTDRHPRYGQHH